jgi:hypothetical protein
MKITTDTFDHTYNYIKIPRASQIIRRGCENLLVCYGQSFPWTGERTGISKVWALKPSIILFPPQKDFKTKWESSPIPCSSYLVTTW